MAAKLSETATLTGPAAAGEEQALYSAATSKQLHALHESTSKLPVNGNNQPQDVKEPTLSLVNGAAKSASYPKSRVDLVDRFLDEPRKLRVAVVGGGLAGIISGCLLPAKVPGVELVIYEKNADFVSFSDLVGGG